MIRIAPSTVIGLVAALAPWPAVAAPATSSGLREWHGTNGWEIAYMPIPGRQSVSGCAMFWNAPPNYVSYRSTMLWVWDHQMLEVGFIGPASPDLKRRLGARNESSVVIVRVDFDARILFTYPTMGAVIDAPLLGGPTLIIEPRFVSWDKNNEGQDTGLETAAIFDRLRSGRVLDVRVYDQTYSEDLRGVGSALDLFPKCLDYAAAAQ